MLAYSTISHVGVVLLCFGVLSPEAAEGAAVYVLGHAGVAGGLFLAAGVVLNRFGTVNERDLFGQARRMRWTGGAFVVGAFGLSGVPGLGLGPGKALTEHALLSAGLGMLVPVVLVPAALTGAAVLRFAGRAFWGVGEPARSGSRTQDEHEEDPETPAQLARAPLAMLVPMVALVLLPTATAVFGHWSWSSIALGVAGGALAASVAAGGLWFGRLPEPVRAVAKAFRPVGHALTVVHRSHIGDYVAWTLAGIVLLAVLLAV